MVLSLLVVTGLVGLALAGAYAAVSSPQAAATPHGHDRMNRLGGDDLLSGLTQDDSPAGDARLGLRDAGAGNDHLAGGTGRDTIFRHEGNDPAPWQAGGANAVSGIVPGDRLRDGSEEGGPFLPDGDILAEGGSGNEWIERFVRDATSESGGEVEESLAVWDFDFDGVRARADALDRAIIARALSASDFGAEPDARFAGSPDDKAVPVRVRMDTVARVSSVWLTDPDFVPDQDYPERSADPHLAPGQADIDDVAAAMFAYVKQPD